MNIPVQLRPRSELVVRPSKEDWRESRRPPEWLRSFAEPYAIRLNSPTLADHIHEVIAAFAFPLKQLRSPDVGESCLRFGSRNVDLYVVERAPYPSQSPMPSD
jgi:hypothetical protein